MMLSDSERAEVCVWINGPGGEIAGCRSVGQQPQRRIENMRPRRAWD